jgi:hypothetical protein
MGVREQFEIRRNNLKKVWVETQGIERVVGIVIYGLKILSLSELIPILLWKEDKAPSSFTDTYVLLLAGFLVGSAKCVSIGEHCPGATEHRAPAQSIRRYRVTRALFVAVHLQRDANCLYVCHLVLLPGCPQRRCVTYIGTDICDHRTRGKDAGGGDASDSDGLHIIGDILEPPNRPSRIKGHESVEDVI